MAWKAPDGTVFRTREEIYDAASRYFTLGDFDEFLDENAYCDDGRIVINANGYRPSTVLWELARDDYLRLQEDRYAKLSPAEFIDMLDGTERCRNGVVDIAGVRFAPSEIARRMSEYAYGEDYAAECWERSGDPETLGFVRVQTGGASGSSKAGGRPSARKPVSKASKPKVKAPARSSKSRSKGGRR